jgi:hypothetical protein
MMMSGSCRRNERRTRAKVRPISGRTRTWFTPRISYSIGSSAVRMRTSSVLISCRNAYSEVDLPEPVGPVARMMPLGRWISLRTSRMSRSLKPSSVSPTKSACFCSRRRLTLSPYTVGMVETRMSMSSPLNTDADAPIHGQTLLGDIQVGHDLDARDDRGLEAVQLRRHIDLVQDAVDAIADAQLLFHRLDMDVGCALRSASAMIWLTKLTIEASWPSSLRSALPTGVGIHIVPAILQHLLHRLGAHAVKLARGLLEILQRRSAPAARACRKPGAAHPPGRC